MYIDKYSTTVTYTLYILYIN